MRILLDNRVTIFEAVAYRCVVSVDALCASTMIDHYAGYMQDVVQSIVVGACERQFSKIRQRHRTVELCFAVNGHCMEKS